MLRAWVVTILPVLFLIVLFGGGTLLRKRNVDQDGAPPINPTVFYASKYLIVVLWGVMILQSWGINLSFFKPPSVVRAVSLSLWAVGFLLLFIGRFGLGSSFRIGSPKEGTGLRVDGLFRLSRNPMYLGVFATLSASVLNTLNPMFLLVAIFIVAAHHKIVLAEEEYLTKAFGEEYLAYCCRVRRYI
jgi:protein-S-isoprenylcysteine O-methyltransferase Ste14